MGDARRWWRCGLLVVLAAGLGRAADASEILVEGVEYDPAVPTVEEVLGQSIGRHHLRHDQLVRYMERLAETSPRIELREQGRTHEGRRQILLVVTSEANHARLTEIRRTRERLVDPAAEPLSDAELATLPSVALLGYSIHGNEASGSNASPLVAYHLAAAATPEVESWLDRTIVLIDPSLNPDGMGRFAQWANMHRGERAVGDPNHREHREGWPSGRTNHYWFDLNRDWLLLQHPESRNRIRTFHEWTPNLLGDYHEMGSDSTYFFQPGVPERENPYKPERNIELTQELAELHARNLGNDGQLFYSGQTFDDFYPGKGSTYPDLNGAVGVLFEQASARGHVQETENGELTFERAIRNHFLTSLSMIEGAAELGAELQRYQQTFYRESMELGRADRVGGYVFGCPRDEARCSRLVELLRGHSIEVHRLGRGVEADGVSHDPAWSWIVPTAQPQYRLVKALFETQTEFEDSTFYDISTWTLPLAFGTQWTRLSRSAMRDDHLGPQITAAVPLEGRFEPDPEAYAYLFEWHAYFAPRALYRLLESDLHPRVTTEPFEIVPGDGSSGVGPRELDRGTIVVPVDGGRREELETVLARVAAEDGVRVWSTRSGLTPSGVDLGSPSIRPLEPLRPMIVSGKGVSSYEVGETWYLLDHRFGIEVSLVESDAIGSVDLGDYTHVLMVDGDYDDWEEEPVAALRRWVSDGGVLVASKRAAVWAQDRLLHEDDGEAGSASAATSGGEAEVAEVEETRRSYADYEHDRAAELVSGAIFEVELDLTHPIAYGYPSERLPVFRNSTHLLETAENPYEQVALYSGEPWLSGYVSEGKLAEIPGTVAVRASRLGSGTVVALIDNPNFRAFWYGTSKLYLNALFFGPIVESTSPPSDW